MLTRAFSKPLAAMLLALTPHPALPAATGGGADAREQALASMIADRETVIFEIVNRLGPQAEILGLDHWQEELTAALSRASPDTLLTASEAEGYQGVVAALSASSATVGAVLANNTGADPLAGGIAALGSTDEHLTFTPLSPCRIVDTREAGGVIAADSSRAFDARGIDLSDQGGGTCADLPDDAAAIAITVTVANPTSPGYLTVYPEATQRPLASTINFTGGAALANSTIVKTAYLQGFDFRVYAFQTTHVVVDLLGVFNPLPAASTAETVSTAMDQAEPLDFSAQTLSTNQSHTSEFSFTSPTCPAGTVYSGPGHSWSGGSAGVWLAEVNRDGSNQRTRCRGLVDRNGASVRITCSAHCVGLQ